MKTVHIVLIMIATGILTAVLIAITEQIVEKLNEIAKAKRNYKLDVELIQFRYSEVIIHELEKLYANTYSNGAWVRIQAEEYNKGIMAAIEKIKEMSDAGEEYYSDN